MAATVIYSLSPLSQALVRAHHWRSSLGLVLVVFEVLGVFGFGWFSDNLQVSVGKNEVKVLNR